VAAAAALLFLMFTTGEAPGRREGLFGAVFFESKEVRPGVIGAEMGVASAVALIGVFVVMLFLVVMGRLAFVWLRAYRAELLKEQANIPG